MKPDDIGTIVIMCIDKLDLEYSNGDVLNCYLPIQCAPPSIERQEPQRV